jgi:hypothetical protein
MAVARTLAVVLHLDHLRTIRPQVRNAAQLETDLSLHNDVLFSLLVVCQAVIDIAGELAGRRAIGSRTTQARSVRCARSRASRPTWPTRCFPSPGFGTS